MHASVFHYGFIRVLDIPNPLIREFDEIFREPFPLYRVRMILFSKFPVLALDLLVGVVS
jgi:hypothetical protein